jgi:hypothetical protein
MHRRLGQYKQPEPGYFMMVTARKDAKEEAKYVQPTHFQPSSGRQREIRNEMNGRLTQNVLKQMLIHKGSARVIDTYFVASTSSVVKGNNSMR